jgi:hypothetical protein
VWQLARVNGGSGWTSAAAAVTSTVTVLNVMLLWQQFTTP